MPQRQAVVSHMTPKSQGLTEARKMPHSSEQFQNELTQEPTQKDFPGGPVVRTPWSQGRGPGSTPSQENSSPIPQPRARMLQLRPGAAKNKQTKPTQDQHHHHEHNTFGRPPPQGSGKGPVNYKWSLNLLV